MNGAAYFLGETTDRQKGLYGIASLELRVVQDRWGHYTAHAWQREQTFSKDSLPRYLRCANPRCQQGGIDLQQIALFYSNGEHTLWCTGHEGTPKGRRRGDSCDNQFTLTLTVVREARSGEQ